MTNVALHSALEILAKLVSFPTISDQSNLPLLDYVCSLLNVLHIENHLIQAPLEQAQDTDKGKANLWAIIGPKHIAGIALSGHTDVVPTAGQDWSHDPFILRVTDDKAYGRGACDMKGFLACVLAMLPYFTSLDLKKPLMLYFSYDEEVGCRGVPHLIAGLGKTLPAPEAVIVGEPSMMQTISAHKSLMLCNTQITGAEGHSSEIHKGVSATMIAAKLIAQIDAMGKNSCENPSADDSARHFDPPYTSMHVGMMRGGEAANIIARKAEFLWDIRSLPSEDPQKYYESLQQWGTANLLPAMQAIAPHSSITTEILCSLPAFHYQENSAAENLVRTMSGDNSLNFASYMAETGLFQKAGFPTVIYGPGSIEQAHKADEWVGLDSLAQCLQFLHDLGQKLSA